MVDPAELDPQPMKLDSLHDLLIHELCDLYDAEQQLIEVLPTMAEAAQSSKLKEAFEEHLKETEEHVLRLERAADSLEFEITEHPCDGMKGLLKEGQKLLQAPASPVRDAAFISAAQRVEHYEIAGYGTACALAKLMGHKEALSELKDTLAEEEKTDKILTQIVEKEINPEAPTGHEV